ncbi:exosortase V [Allopontixanthobacter sediminis]|uniref:Exosortase V n=1 Tax=Allopontixanthobacter sediminis TaxID=1689985 RepID=A0A845B001_9SPHN|nr:exosortase V [Allopontixanthobacter sediminis]MXP44611.1 exosortase V [Allopontixanthobacter sediminis]
MKASGNLHTKRAPYNWARRFSPALIGLIAISYPTWQFVATESWSTEQGSLGPFILASGVWLLFRMLPETKVVQSRPPAWQAFGAIFLMAAALIVLRIAAVIELEVYALYGLLIALLFAFIGWRAIKILWFPLLYLLFAVPLPDSLVAALTNPLKLWISDTAVALLYLANYPIASSGVTIQIGQYQLLVAAACAGLSSLITLSALTLFYVYLIHRSNWRYMMVLIAAAVPIAIFSNLVRVLLLILITYHVGEAAAQGFLHNFAGMTTFAIALIMIYALDKVAQTIIAFRTKELRVA